MRSWSEPGRALRRVLWALLLLPPVAAPLAEPARETWRAVPMPPGFQVLVSELEGPVFADAAGRTLYQWPQHRLRNGYSGEAPGTPACYGEPRRVTAGLMSPYPAGIPLPDADSRPGCTDRWPPVLAAADAQPVGEIGRAHV